jgi:molecular chaperone DnaJ
VNVAEAYGILRLPKGAGSDEVKTAYRKLAFELHPDLNPDDPSASRRFQLLNEAYVLIKQVLEEEPPAAAGAGKKRRKAAPKDEKPKASQAEASREYKKQAGATPPPPGPGAEANAGAKTANNGPSFTFRKEEVLRDIMNDPFARRVFEDIYRTVRQSGRAGTPLPAPLKERKLTLRWGGKSVSVDLSKGVVGGVKDWLTKSMDDEQTIEIPAHQLTPGARIRLTIRRAWTGEPKTVEVPLPPDYVPGRPLRLKGLGRKLGPWTGDLYIRLVAK